MIGISRSAEVDTEKCVEQVGNRFDLAILASAHSREIKRLNRNSEQYKHQHTVITSLLDIQDGTVDPETLICKTK